MRPKFLTLAALAASAISSVMAQVSPPVAPKSGEHITLIGNGLGERMCYYNYFESLLHLRYPTEAITVRNNSKSGDTAGFRPHPARESAWAFPGAEKFNAKRNDHHGKGFFPTPDEWLKQLQTDTVIAFFGYNESFEGQAGLSDFKNELDAFVKYTQTQNYNGKGAPRLVLVSPTAYEDLSDKKNLPNGVAENANLRLYRDAMREVAEQNKVGFVDLLTPTEAIAKSKDTDFTINGFSLSDWGYRQLAPILADGVFGKQAIRSKADAKLVYKAVQEKDWMWQHDFYILNGVHAYGQRYNPYGPQNYPDEIKKTREMTALREQRLHEIVQGKSKSVDVEDSKTLPLPPVPTNFKAGIQYLKGDEAMSKFQTAPGFKIEMFASEQEFPDLINPVQMSFDSKGRLWVATCESYPHYLPGGKRPNDKLLILEDTNGDGKADKQTVFADGLQLPLGFEITAEGVYVSQEPNLCLLVDDNKDDKADRMELLLHGFDTHDTHHAIHAFSSDASGAFHMGEGRFLHSQVETPYGPQRCNDGGVWRFDPKNFRLERRVQCDLNNPWGIIFDDWDQMFIADASSGNNWWGLPVSAKMPYGVEIPKTEEFAPKRARPTAGGEFISSRHFPDEYQGRFLLNNCIGFLGTSMHEIYEDESGFSGKHVGDLITCSDPNVRIVDLEFARDGSLYLVDWHNALVGHMQHNARDPNRDKSHGRIYRVTYPSRPLLKPVKVAGATVKQLLENLKEPEYRARYHTRRELRTRPQAEVLSELKKWVTGLNPQDPRYEHHLCEALWASWAQNKVDVDLLKMCLSAKAHQARAAAVTVLRYNYATIPGSTEMLMKAATDEHGRVRMEAFVAASWLDNADGARIALEALKKPLDKWMGPVFESIMKYTLHDDVEALQKAGQLQLADNPNAKAFLSGKLKMAVAAETAETKTYGPTRELSAEEKVIYEKGREVFHRDAHCATCHQPNGQGLPNIYPPLAPSSWTDGNEERMIKIALKGLWGPIEVAGKKFDPKNGVPPMPGFGGLLNDEEVAAVLSYVRNSFDNKASFIKPETVAKVRKETAARTDYYMVEDILKEHPLEK